MLTKSTTLPTEMVMVPKPQQHRPQLAVVDQSRERQPEQVNHWTHSRRRTTASQRTREVRKEKEAPHPKEGKGGVSSRGTLAGVPPSGEIVMSGATTGLEMLKEALAN